MHRSAASYRDLVVWQRALDLGVTVYGLTRGWPKSEAFGLTSQVRRAAVSVAANIAEGYGRATGREFAQFLSVARGSLLEVETLIELGLRVGYVDEVSAARLALETEEIGKMLRALRSRVLERPAEAGRPPRTKD